MSLILMRTSITYKFLNIVGPISHVQIANDNRGNRIFILPHATWKRNYIHRETDIERLMQSTVPSSSPILNVELIKIYDTNNVKLTLNVICLYIKPTIVLFLFELEQCVEHVLYELSQYARC